MKNIKRLVVGAIMVLFAIGATATERPEVIIDNLTKDMLVAIETAKPTFVEDPEPFYTQLETLVMPVLDMRNFTRGVMGEYGSSKYYRSLTTKAEKQAFKNRILTFADIFKESVVRTYGKGLMTFDGQEIVRQPLSEEDEKSIVEGKSLEIVQLIQAPGSDDHELRYSFGRNNKGQWLVRNMLVDGINLGRVYQSQFSQAVKDQDGDVDAAISNWRVSADDFNE